MMLERADRLTSLPVVGQFYLVPAIKWNPDVSTIYGLEPAEIIRTLQAAPGATWWPVWGRKHADIEYFNFEHQHYHIDPRFLTKRQWARYEWKSSKKYTRLQRVQMSPLNHRELPDGLPPPRLRRMRCTMAHSEWEHGEQPLVRALNLAFAGHQCRKSKLGFICPHQKFPLGSVETVDGVITCPLHGLRIDAQLGVCLGSAKPDSASVIEGSVPHHGMSSPDSNQKEATGS